jgi:hypothetical protein
VLGVLAADGGAATGVAVLAPFLTLAGLLIGFRVGAGPSSSTRCSGCSWPRTARRPCGTSACWTGPSISCSSGGSAEAMHSCTGCSSSTWREAPAPWSLRHRRTPTAQSPITHKTGKGYRQGTFGAYCFSQVPPGGERDALDPERRPRRRSMGPALGATGARLAGPGGGGRLPDRRLAPGRRPAARPARARPDRDGVPRPLGHPAAHLAVRRGADRHPGGVAGRHRAELLPAPGVARRLARAGPRQGGDPPAGARPRWRRPAPRGARRPAAHHRPGGPPAPAHRLGRGRSRGALPALGGRAAGRRGRGRAPAGQERLVHGPPGPAPPSGAPS